MSADCPAAFLTASDLTFRYFEQSETPILDHASLTVNNGEITVLTGDSGCGKSTLAAVLAGLYPENAGELRSGTVDVCGLNIHTLGPARRARYLVLMFQNPLLQFCMDTLRKELIFCLENLATPAEEIDSLIDQFADRLHLHPLLDRPLTTLSGGEQQKCALCCLLLMRPQGIILDEPFANIDPDGAAEILSMLKAENQQYGTTILAIDHHPKRWQGIARRFITLATGARIIADGALPLPQTLTESSSRQPRSDKPSEGVPAITLQDFSISTAAPSAAPLLVHADAEFRKGKITAIIGASGIGKTTLFHALLGLHPYQGSALLGGAQIRSLKAKELFARIGLVFQNPSQQFISTSVETEITETLRLQSPHEEKTVRARRAGQFLKEYGLSAYTHYSPYLLSQGQQRRLAVLSMLAGERDVLLLDEPTYGQDPHSTQAVMEHLRLKADAGLAVIMTTHDIDAAMRYADTVYHFKERRLALWNIETPI